MADGFVWLTPILVLAVMLLVRFVGCDLVWGLEGPPFNKPTGLDAEPGDRRVALTWTHLASEGALNFILRVSTIANDDDAERKTVMASGGDQHQGEIVDLTNDTGYYFSVEAIRSDKSARSDEIFATPLGSPFVVSTTLAGVRNDFDGWVGMRIEVGPEPIRVTRLGRLVAPGNVRQHVVKLVDIKAGNADMESVTIPLATVPSGQFQYESLSQPVDLVPFQPYYLVSHEELGGDSWYDLPTAVTTRPEARVLSAVYNPDATPGYLPVGTEGQAYGPVDFMS